MLGLASKLLVYMLTKLAALGRANMNAARGYFGKKHGVNVAIQDKLDCKVIQTL